MNRPLPLVAVVGRPNVGKSTFFNRIIGGATAVVDDVPGVTRDRREASTSWTEVPFRFMDTGGLVPGTDDSMEAAILTQAWLAVQEADLILFMVDAKDGLTALDREIAQALRPHQDKVMLVANKVEGREREIAAQEASSLGFGVPILLSGQHGEGVGDLLDLIIGRIPHVAMEEDDSGTIRLALLGRPNVGKSSIANRLLGEDRMIVHDSAGTTRDAIDAPFRFDGCDYMLIDTAGLRRRSHVTTGIEYYSTLRTTRSLERCHVAVLVLDATQTVAMQDARIAGMIRDAGKSMIFAVNKWDLVEKSTGTTETYTKALAKKFPALSAAPVLFISAKNNLRVSRIPPTARDLYEERTRHITTSKLNEVLQGAMAKLQPPIGKNGRPLRFYYATQTAHVPPTFVIFANAPQDMPAAYRNYLLNTFREQLGFRATPIRMSFRARKQR